MTLIAPHASQSTVLVATAGGGRQHLPQCPHVVGRDARPVEAGRDLPVCDWSTKELTGLGRTRYAHLDAALDAFGVQVQNRALIKHALTGVVHDEIWMPYSASYIALGWGGRGVALTGKTYVVPAPGTSIELPGFLDTSRGAARDTDRTWGTTCNGCQLVRSRNGSCECG